MDKRIFGFVAAGGMATVLNYSVFWVLLQLGMHYLWASAVGYASGIALSFAINKYLVFQGSQEASFLRYLLAYSIALVFQLALLNILVSNGVPPEIANGLSISIVVVLNFFLVRKIVFSERH